MIAQNEEVPHRRATAVVTIAAGVTSLASLIVGLSGADFDFEAVSEAATFIVLGTDAVAPVRWGLWLSMFGSSDLQRLSTAELRTERDRLRRQLDQPPATAAGSWTGPPPTASRPSRP